MGRYKWREQTCPDPNPSIYGCANRHPGRSDRPTSKQVAEPGPQPRSLSSLPCVLCTGQDCIKSLYRRLASINLKDIKKSLLLARRFLHRSHRWIEKKNARKWRSHSWAVFILCNRLDWQRCFLTLGLRQRVTQTRQGFGGTGRSVLGVLDRRELDRHGGLRPNRT